MVLLAVSGLDGLAPVIWVLVLAELAGRIVLVGLSLLAARQVGIAGFLLVPLPRIREKYPDIVSFTGLANLGDAVLKVAQQLDIFIVAALLAPAEAGLFRAVKSLGSVPQLAAGAVSQVLYPAIAHRDLMGGRELWAFLRPVWLGLAAASLAGCLVYFLVSGYLVPLLFGADYVAAVAPSVIYMAGASLGLALVPVTPLVLVRGQQRRLFVSYLGAAAAYAGGVTIGAAGAGLTGAAAGLAALYIVYAIISALFWMSGRK
jgi:O-antigen/teichoic acid export membrane protein